ncbi:sigma-70 family RNA polymerase sigma factor [Paenibacillus bovis]|uniref:RNA polymerase n=1 Tax=Paenibacillus bovis TaxID=1616788 RepID=A0A172ZJ58_9BACL|nr:sigma-70 family RNA polymerase sigma factor [Paenibacillus bovis]ANF97432.1 hypothetical protein AR543_16405 [Paenibacillus bovis]
MEWNEEVIRAQQGDQQAFTKLIHRLDMNLYRLARSILRNDEDCADAIQETIVKAYLSLAQLRQPKAFKSWIYRILINECYATLRRQERVVSTGEEISIADVHNYYERVDLLEVVDQLDQELRAAVILYYFEDIAVRDIAKLLAISPGTVKSRLYRARAILAAKLELETDGGIRYE